MQYYTIYPHEGYGLPVDFELLPQKLKELCYSTYAIGKWHLGFCADEYLPQNRGFDEFYGTYTSGVDYFEKTSRDPLTDESAYDLHQNKKKVKPNENKYLSEQCLEKATRYIDKHDTDTPLFMYYAFQLTGSPLQVPQDKLDQFSHINPERRAFMAMASVMDDAIQSVVDALEDKDMLDNTYIVFLSDNGGEVTKGGNNWPLRGNKGTLYDGAMRTPAFVWAKPGTGLMSTGGNVASGFMHAVDWFPTILSIAGGTNTDVNMDGKDQSLMLLEDVSVHLRTEFLYALDESMNAANKRAYRFGDFKLIEGEPSYMYPVRINDDTDDVFVLPYGAVSPVITNYSPIIPVPGEPVPQPAPAPSVPQTLLYNVKNDPTEQNNLAGNFRVYVLILSSKINMERIKGVESLKLNETAWNKDVALYNEMIAGGVWMPGWCSAISL
ncbi:arylsulfatase I-like [Saccoglossus kowalevskii]|uniref:Arylsulfatase I-like n=1 Tax=Saccoglossus kowalevskii TaxID=10224 RepID=A0ABM0M6W9_SACKO|nr:PREDICTED: arylsulfatase I-like [Saccoglossus kowalevskii]